MNESSGISVLNFSGLNEEQAQQVMRQWMMYMAGTRVGAVALRLLGKECLIEVAPFVANPLIMNSGLHVADFLCRRPELVEGKVVVDMGTGSGVIGISSALLGATKVLMPDLDEKAAQCALFNVKRNGLVGTCEVFMSDLFSQYCGRPKADVQIFNHPFFSIDPAPGNEWMRVMLGGTELLGRYFEEVPRYSHKETIYLLPWLTLAGNEGVLDNDPGKRAPEYGFEIVERYDSKPLKAGIQQGSFVIYVLRHV